MFRLYGKLFFAFWGLSFVVTAVVGVMGFFVGRPPLVYAWLTHSLDDYAQTAVELYEHGGSSALDRYLSDLNHRSGLICTLLDGQGAPLALEDHPIPVRTEEILRRSVASGRTEYDQRNWVAAIVVPSGEKRYTLLAEVVPLRRRRLGAAIDPALFGSRIAVALFVTMLLSLLMARHLTVPIQRVQAVARRIAAGDLKARALPLLGSRKDELADLAADVDRMAERVQWLLERQQALLRDISHELRSPLARLSLSAELVRRGDLEAAGRMNKDILRLEDLIGELLTISRIEASEPASRSDLVHLPHMVQQIVQDASFEGQPEDKSLVQTGDKDVTVTGDANLLQRCLENLVRNAVQYTRPGTVVEVCVERMDDLAVVRVSDEGPGVPEESLERIFEPFYRVSEHREHHRGGTGVGLAICRRVAALHGGTVQARNRAEGGLEVELRLPIAFSSEKV